MSALVKIPPPSPSSPTLQKLFTYGLVKYCGSSATCEGFCKSFFYHIGTTLRWHFTAVGGVKVVGFCQVVVEGEMYLWIKRVIIVASIYHH